MCAILRVGPLAYPPTPTTTSGLKSSRIFLAIFKLFNNKNGNFKFFKIDFKVKDKRPGSLYKVRVTKVIAKHTCLMSNSAYRVAKQNSHSSNIDLTEVSTVVNYLEIDPHLKAKELRNLLKDCLPSYFVIDSMFLNDFR